MGQAGNRNYTTEKELPSVVSVFPLEGALLLPGGQMPLNIFEPRYLQMIDDAIAGERIVGMIQPSLVSVAGEDGERELCAVGCLGREGRQPYRRCRIKSFIADLDLEREAAEVDREALLGAFRMYLEANQLEADWASVVKASNETLVNALCMMSPYGAAEKQALLEAPDLKTRAETLVAITEISLAREGNEDGPGPTLQ